MSDSKRPADDELPTFEDSADLVNAVISTLLVPEEQTNVSAAYANDKNIATEVQAYAKIAGRDWTYYVKSLAISIGRNTDATAGATPQNQSLVDIDLGPAKVVSRQHAAITYNINLRCWELKVSGRNGARVDSVKLPVGGNHATPLHSGAILDIGGTQMMFILPDSPPNISQKMLDLCLARYKQNSHKLPRLGSAAYASSKAISTPQKSAQTSSFNGISSFHMFDKGVMANSPSSVSAVSLQNNLDQDLSKEDAKDIKPPYSYATMITQAILSNPDGVMSLSEIYNWISSHYAYYKYSKTGWQNSIRHNLSLNKAFEKVPRRPNEPGKGMKWQISDSYRNDFLKKVQTGTLSKSRRGSSVSRTLQIHLATHQGLPESKNNQNSETLNRSGSYDPQQNTPNSLNSNSGPITKANQQLPYPMIHLNHMQQGYDMQQVPQNGYNYAYGNVPFQQRTMMYTNQNHQQSQLLPPQNYKPIDQTSPARNQSLDVSAAKQMKAGNGDMFFSHQRNNSSQNGSSSFAPGMLPYKLPAEQANLESGGTIENGGPNSFSNTSNIPNSSESMIQTSTAPSTSNTSELGLGFTSPKKIVPLEAFTPERGSRSGNYPAKSGNGNVNQSSPAFWNFVQFSTPNGQTPGRKNSDESNGPESPTLHRAANDKKGDNVYDDSPPKSKEDIHAEPKTVN